MGSSKLEAFAFVVPWVLLERDRDVALEVRGVLLLVSVTLGLLIPLVRAWCLNNLVVF